MKTHLSVLVTACLIVGIVTMPGCDSADVAALVQKNKVTVIKGITLGAQQASYRGLKALAKNSPDTVKEAATALVDNVDNVLLPYFNGEKVGSSAEVKALLDTTLFKKVPPEMKAIIATASAVLDIYLPVPGSDTFLDADQKDYVKAFLTGLSDGAKDCLGTSKGMPVQRNWIAPQD